LLTLPHLHRQAAAMQSAEAYTPHTAPCSDLSCSETLIAVCRGGFE
jgi:hypothetical protein